MGERKKESFSPPALGGSSLLVVFAVLALTVFALLSLSTVRADVRLGDAAAKAIQDYYAADVKAQEILARIRWEDDVPEGVGEAGTDFSGLEYTYRYSVPISENRELQVEIQRSDLREPGGPYFCRILRWQAVQTDEWVPDEGPGFWDGEFIF